MIGIGLFGGLGAVARLVLDGTVAQFTRGDFPYGTLAVNLLGSLIAGALLGLAVSNTVHRLVATGLIGAFTTFSTWMFETHRLSEDGQRWLAALNLVGSLILGVLAAWAGRHVGAWL